MSMSKFRMQSSDSSEVIDEIDEADEAFLAEALADLGIADSEDVGDDDDAYVRVNVDDVLALSDVDPTSLSLSTSSLMMRASSSKELSPHVTTNGDILSHHSSASPSSRNRSNSKRSSRSPRSPANGINVVGTVETSIDDLVHRDLRSEFDEELKEPPEPSPSTPLVEDDIDSIYIEETPSRTPAFLNSSGGMSVLVC